MYYFSAVKEVLGSCQVERECGGKFILLPSNCIANKWGNFLLLLQYTLRVEERTIQIICGSLNEFL